jgi:hypothetical protein
MKKRKAKRYYEGGDIPDIDREPLRDSSGEIVRSSSGEAVMSGGTPTRARQEDIDLGRRMREQRDAEAMDIASLRPTRASVAETSPVRKPPVLSGTNIQDREDTGVGLLAGLKPPVKAPVKAPTKAPAPVSMGRTAMGKTAAQESEAEMRRQGIAKTRDLESKAKSQALETVNPEMNLLGGPALRGLRAAGAGMASRLAPAQAARRGERTLEPAEKYMGEVEMVMERNRRRMLPNQRGGEGVITPPAKPFPERNKRRILTEASKSGETIKVAPRPYQRSTKGDTVDLDEIRMGSDFMKKGGRVKAYKSGGSVSSASKRADGIATKGKTRGRYI